MIEAAGAPPGRPRKSLAGRALMMAALAAAAWMGPGLQPSRPASAEPAPRVHPVTIPNLRPDDRSATRPRQETPELARRWIALATAEGVPRDLPRLREDLAELDGKVERILDSQVLDDGVADLRGLWRLKNLAGTRQPSERSVYWAANNIRKMVLAYRTPGTRHFGRDDVLDRIRLALRAFAGVYRGRREDQKGNWWHWDVGVPLRLGDALILLGDALPAADASALTGALRRQLFEPNLMGIDTDQDLSNGSNRGRIAMNALRLGILTDDPSLLDAARRLFAEAGTVKPFGISGGLMADGSFHQHGSAVNLGYGHAYLNMAARFIYLTRDLAVAPGERFLDDTLLFFRDFVAWVWRRGAIPPYLMGRSGTRSFDESVRMASSAFLLAAGDPGRFAAPVRRFMADWTGKTDLSAEDLTRVHHLGWLAAADLTDPADGPADGLTGVRYFPYSDLLVGRSDGALVSVRLSDRQTKTWFSINGEGVLSHQDAEGAVLIVTDGRHNSVDARVARPWSRQMGVTFDSTGDLKRRRESRGTSRFTHGIDLPGAGLAATAYHLGEKNRTIEARKSYFFLRGALVLVGDRITATVDGEIQTSLLALPVAADAVVHGADGAAPVSVPFESRGLAADGPVLVHAGDVGLVVGPGDPVTVEAHEIALKWRDINRGERRDGRRTRRHMTVFATAHHGRKPSAGRYQATLLAGWTLDAARRFLAQPTVTVLETADPVHAVRSRDGTIGLAAFFAPGTSPVAAMTGAGVVGWQRLGATLHVSLNVPADAEGTLRLPFAGAVAVAEHPGEAAPDVAVIAGRPQVVVSWTGSGRRQIRLTVALDGE